MLGGQASPAVTIRAIINRGGEQGAQHSQALHAWFEQHPLTEADLQQEQAPMAELGIRLEISSH